MSPSIPTVQKYMTMVPHCVGSDQTIHQAQELMRRHDIRHLPVLAGGKLLGILTDRDVRLLESLDHLARALPVSEAMTEEPYAVAPDTPLDRVVEEMAKHKYGSAIVVDHHQVVGIFTTVDACRALHELLAGPTDDSAHPLRP